MKLLKLNLPKQDTKSIYYVVDTININGSVSKVPNQNYRLAIKTSVTINGKKVYKRKVQEFKKIQTLISAIGVMQGVRASLKLELKANAPIIAKVEAQKAKKQNYSSEENYHTSRTLDMAWLDYMVLKEAKNLSWQTLKSYRLYKPW